MPDETQAGTAQNARDPPTEGRTHTTGAGVLEPREIERGANGSPGEVVPRDEDLRGSGGDVVARSQGPAIHGLRDAPAAGSVLGNQRGLSRPPHDAAAGERR